MTLFIHLITIRCIQSALGITIMEKESPSLWFSKSSMLKSPAMHMSTKTVHPFIGRYPIVKSKLVNKRSSRLNSNLKEKIPNKYDGGQLRPQTPRTINKTRARDLRHENNASKERLAVGNMIGILFAEQLKELVSVLQIFRLPKSSLNGRYILPCIFT